MSTVTSHAAGKAVVNLYDDRMYDGLIEEYYAGTGFLNYGYWEPGITDAGQAGANLVDKLLDMIPDHSGTILDVACGTGATTRHILRRYPPQRVTTVTAVNISQKQLITARARAADSKFARMDGANLAFGDESFDNMICVEAAFHFNTRESFLRDAVRVLRPGGTLVLSDALIAPTQIELRPHWNPANMIVDLNEYEAVYRRAGFARVQIVDATENCWKGCFWNIVRFMHQRFWEGRITLEQKDQFLDRVYRMAGDLEHYVLVAAQKAGRI